MLVAQVNVLKLPMMQLLQVERVGPPLACLLVAVLRGEAGLALDCYSSLLQVHLGVCVASCSTAVSNGCPAGGAPAGGPLLPAHGGAPPAPRLPGPRATRRGAGGAALRLGPVAAVPRLRGRVPGGGGRPAWRITLVVKLGGLWVRLGEVTARALLPGAGELEAVEPGAVEGRQLGPLAVIGTGDGVLREV